MDIEVTEQDLQIQNLIETMSKSLVDDPAQVQVRICRGEQTTVFELQVHKLDLGKVIGKQGRNAQAMRVVMNAAATKLRRRMVLEILDGK